ncbi:hypothetical protein PG993_005502 [Apiospora rasikravindrae]|uniref:Uncharacterized protein n=1 Tax=Apiospora rasikravindrae TaxID=990691 RepID=A0ABR1TFR6_9PEZI
MSRPPLHLVPDTARHNRQNLLEFGSSLLTGVFYITLAGAERAMPTAVAIAEDRVIQHVLDMNKEDPSRHQALPGGWSHDFVAWLVDKATWDIICEDIAQNDEFNPQAKFGAIFPQPDQSASPFDTWLPSINETKSSETQLDQQMSQQDDMDLIDKVLKDLEIASKALAKEHVTS